LNHALKTFFVNGALNSDMWQSPVDTSRCHAGIRLGVLCDLLDGSDDLSNSADKRLEEEPADPHLEGCTEEQCQTCVVLVNPALDGKAAPTNAQCENDECACYCNQECLVKHCLSWLLCCKFLIRAICRYLLCFDVDCLLRPVVFEPLLFKD